MTTPARPAGAPPRPRCRTCANLTVEGVLALVPATESEPDPVAAFWRWCRGVAQAVRRGFRFQAGGQEEQDLYSEAQLVVLQQTPRYDPAEGLANGDVRGAYRGALYREIRTRCVRLAKQILAGGLIRVASRRDILAVPLGDDASSLADESEVDYRDARPEPELVPITVRTNDGRRLARTLTRTSCRTPRGGTSRSRP